MRLIKTVNLMSSTEEYVTIPQGNYKKFILVLLGVNGVGGSTDFSNNTIKLDYRGNEIINADLIFFANLAQVWDDFVMYTPGAAGANFQYQVPIPCYSHTNPANGYPVRANDNVYLRLSWNQTNLASGTLKIYGVTTQTPFSYFSSYRRFDQSIGGAGSARQQVQAVNVERIFHLGVTPDFTAVLTRAQIEVNNKVRVDVHPMENYWEMRTRNKNNSNIALSSLFINEYILTGGDSVLQAINSNVETTYTTTGAISPLRQYYNSIGFNDALVFESQEIVSLS